MQRKALATLDRGFHRRHGPSLLVSQHRHRSLDPSRKASKRIVCGTVLAAIPAPWIFAGAAVAIGAPGAALDAEMQERAAPSLHQAAPLGAGSIEKRLAFWL